MQKLHSVRVRGGTSKGTDPSGKRPKCIAGSTKASVTINTLSRVVMDCYRDCNAIGRFVLRARGCTIAVGFCNKIMSCDQIISRSDHAVARMGQITSPSLQCCFRLLFIDTLVAMRSFLLDRGGM